MKGGIDRRVVLGLVGSLAFLAGTANAGYLGDNVTVSLTVHTTGAFDQVVWSNTPAVVAPGLMLQGDSLPADVTGILYWTLDGVGSNPMCFLLTVFNTSPNPTTVEPLLFTITGLDAMPVAGVVIGGTNTLGVLQGDISFTGNSFTVSSAALNPMGPFDIFQVEFCIVPEVSSVATLALAASAAGGTLWRRRRRST